MNDTMASPTSSLNELTSGSSSPIGVFMEKLSLDGTNLEVSPMCSVCQKTYNSPKVLPCLHTFCLPCIEKLREAHPEKKVKCPQCQQETFLTNVNSLPCDYGLLNLLEKLAMKGNLMVVCTGCKGDTLAAGRCYDCNNFLCANCLMAHEFMLCFDKHHLNKFSEVASLDTVADYPVVCTLHKNSYLYFCSHCCIPLCKECYNDHPRTSPHELAYLHEVAPREIQILNETISEAKGKFSDLYQTVRAVEQSFTKIKMNYEKAQNDIMETFNFYQSCLEERKVEIIKELDHIYNNKQLSLTQVNQRIQEALAKMQGVWTFFDKIAKYANPTEKLVFKKTLESKIQNIFNVSTDITASHSELEFLSNYQAIQVGVRNTFGYIRHSTTDFTSTKPQPIARPNGILSEKNLTNGHVFDSSIISKRFSSPNSLGPFTTSVSDVNFTCSSTSNGPYNTSSISSGYQSATSPAPYPSSGSTNVHFNSNLSDVNTYEKWSSGGNDIFQNGTDTFSALSSTESMLDIGKFSASTALYPIKSQLKRQKMIYHCKFGEFGIMEGQFTEPSGVAVNAQNDIIVADTNNHRIQIFDREGRFKFQFGECGKRDGQLLYPNRVAVVRTSGDIIVTERSPTHQIQIYNQYGQFVRKFGANILQHPRGVTVDNKGRIIVVECKVMRVIIFDQGGAILTKFGCSKHLEFPNGVVVNDKQEIFISDNRAHCVKVFDYEGHYLRQIGGEGLTNYPIGVCISPAGEILVADNHNNFNITIFTQDGTLVNALESKVKHAQCFDVALMDDGSVVLASKDYRLYVYRYMQLPSTMAI